MRLPMLRRNSRRTRDTVVPVSAASFFFVSCIQLVVLKLVYLEEVESFATIKHESIHCCSNFQSMRQLLYLSSTPSDDAEEQVTYYSPNKPLFLDEDNNFSRDDAANNIDDGSSAANEYSFFDEATITVRAGSGGQGSSTYKKGTGGQDGIADGGSGGRGGNVILITDPSLNTLARLTNAWRPNAFGGSGAAATPKAAVTNSTSDVNSRSYSTKHFRAENGGNGERMYNNGRYGDDVTIRVPPGTVVQEQIMDDETGEIIGFVELGILGLAQKGVDAEDNDGENEQNQKAVSTLIVARGGEGGEGSAAAGKRRGVKRTRLPPQSGERKTLKLTLKIVADVALVGVPNAGKSTFLAAVTR
jgi:GTPase involved in cell partitioning and DNA repair